VKSVEVDGVATPCRLSRVASTTYADFVVENSRPRTVTLRY
jgi:hypothetical protein